MADAEATVKKTALANTIQPVKLNAYDKKIFQTCLSTHLQLFTFI